MSNKVSNLQLLVVNFSTYLVLKSCTYNCLDIGIDSFRRYITEIKQVQSFICLFSEG